MKILSLFDGMACGMLAMQAAGIAVDRYVAFEIDKHAIKTSSHNFPMIEHRGDVFQADFTEFYGFDFLIGGSPCTYWSIAQKNNRETEASGMGWELFSQYVRALREAQPMYFIYENNKSMSKAIRESITETFGFEPICINSSRVSAQNRQRLYWVGKRNLDGTYSKVRVDQPEDRGILLRDVLDGLTDREKGRCVLSSVGRTTTREYFKKDQGTMAFEPVAINTTTDGDKARTLMAGYYKYGTATLITNEGFTGGTTAVAEPVRIPEYGDRDKARPLNALYPNNCGGWWHRVFSENPNKQQVDLIAQPIYAKAMQALKDAWENYYAGNANTVILNDGMEFQEASNTSRENETNAKQITFNGEIKDIFHIGATYEETIKNAIMPIAVAFATALNRDFLLEKEKKSFYFAPDTKELYKGSMKERFDAYKIAIECGFKTRNEIRYMEDDDALEGLDVINLGLGDVLLDTKTGNIYTPNTNSTVNMGGGEPVSEDGQNSTEAVKVDTEN